MDSPDAAALRRVEMLNEGVGSPEDLAEAARRLHKLAQALARLDELGLDDYEPATTYQPGEAGR